jgi:hypothetical protein
MTAKALQHTDIGLKPPSPTSLMKLPLCETVLRGCPDYRFVIHFTAMNELKPYIHYARLLLNRRTQRPSLQHGLPL